MPSYSEARSLANKRNAQKSTGPRTAAGKARSSANALKHGLTGEGICLPIEDAEEVQVRVDRLSEELCPVTEQELFYTRRAAMLTLRVDRCYLKETFHLRMAVRDAIPDYDKRIFEEVRAIIRQMDEDPFGSVERLKQTAQGVDWMVDQWRELRASFAESGNLNQIELDRADRLQGRRYNATGNSRIHELSFMVESGLERVNGEPRTSPEQVEACKVRSKLEFEALLSRQIEDLLAHRATLPLADAELSRQEAPMRAVVDLSHQGQLLRRYETAAARELHKIFEYFDAIRAAEAADFDGVTLESAETSAESASFRDPAVPEPSGPVTGPNPRPESELGRVVEIAQTIQPRPISEPKPSVGAFAFVFERPSRE